jgi:hypothetical protein
MATAGTALTARHSTAPGRASRRRTATANPTGAIHFDGRDVTEPVMPKLTARGGAAVRCGCCGTLRDARLAFCCEFAAFANGGQGASTRRTRVGAVSAA